MSENAETAATVWRLPELERQVGIPSSSVYRLIQEEGFPQPIRISNRRTAWWSHEVIAWLKQRPVGLGEGVVRNPAAAGRKRLGGDTTSKSKDDRRARGKSRAKRVRASK